MIDPHARLIAALVARAGEAEVVQACSRPWASVTYTGARHLVRLMLPAAIADRLGEGLDEHEFAIPRHIVADIAIASRHDTGGIATVEIEALTIEEG
jgi:uncharacterized membrane protein